MTMREIVGEAKIAKGQYWSKTLTIVKGCTPVSEGCAHCWSAAMASRFPWGRGFAEGGKWTGKVERNTDGWRYLIDRARSQRRLKPQVFCIWNDLLHEKLPKGWFLRCLEAMRNCKNDIFLVLTKRPERLQDIDWSQRIMRADGLSAHRDERIADAGSNIWIGVSVESQEHVDRIQTLIAAWPGRKFVSIEPCLGQVNLFDTSEGVLRGPAVIKSGGMTVGTEHEPAEGYDDSYSAIDWVILGGETGPHARPMHPDWARSIRNQCVEAGVPFFFKHWGEYISRQEQNEANDKFVWCCKRVGKKNAGRLLEGRTWDEMPEVRE